MDAAACGIWPGLDVGAGQSGDPSLASEHDLVEVWALGQPSSYCQENADIRSCVQTLLILKHYFKILKSIIWAK